MLHGNLNVGENLETPDAGACIDMGVGATAFAAAIDTGMPNGTASSEGTAVAIGIGAATPHGTASSKGIAVAIGIGAATPHGSASPEGTAVGIGIGPATACMGTPIATGMGCDAI